MLTRDQFRPGLRIETEAALAAWLAHEEALFVEVPIAGGEPFFAFYSCQWDALDIRDQPRWWAWRLAEGRVYQALRLVAEPEKAPPAVDSAQDAEYRNQ